MSPRRRGFSTGRHWLIAREKGGEAWRRKLFINGIGLALTSFILISVTLVKFTEGGWITLVITALAVLLASAIKGNYQTVFRRIRRLDSLKYLKKFCESRF